MKKETNIKVEFITFYKFCVTVYWVVTVEKQKSKLLANFPRIQQKRRNYGTRFFQDTKSFH